MIFCLCFMDRIRPIQQDRAARSSQAFSRAALELMADRPLESITVAEIVARAGLSVGAFYARFSCKEALIDQLCEHRLRDAGQRLEEQVGKLERSEAGLESMVKCYVDEAIALHRENRVLLREVVRTAFGEEDPDVLAGAIGVNRDVTGGVAAALLARRAEIAHPDPERAVRMVPVFVASMLRSYLLFPHVLSQEEQTSPIEGLRNELTRWIMSYLTGKEQSDPQQQ
jgi:AcrR family transcriptional regulator